MAEAFRDVYTYHRSRLTEIWSALRQFDGKPDEELPRLIISDEQRKLIDEYYRQMVSFVALALPDKDLRAPILRSRLNLYRMLMIVAVLRRHEEMGSAEELFAEKLFTVAEADLRWGLAYIFYCMMQTSAMYNRLRREEKEEARKAVRISALALLEMLPTAFTREIATYTGSELGIKERAVTYHLSTLIRKGYIVRIEQGRYRKVKRATKQNKQAA
jgi:DNA-binding transcriptional ArsR family regulator